MEFINKLAFIWNISNLILLGIILVLWVFVLKYMVKNSWNKANWKELIILSLSMYGWFVLWGVILWLLTWLLSIDLWILSIIASIIIWTISTWIIWEKIMKLKYVTLWFAAKYTFAFVIMAMIVFVFIWAILTFLLGFLI